METRRTYHANGQPQTMELYTGEDLVKRTKFNEEGEVLEKEYWYRGEMIRQKFYNRDVGVIIEYYLSNGKDNGVSREWTFEGILSSERYFVDGEMHGLHRVWYENGLLASEHPYVNGKREGVSKAWYDNGQPIYEMESIASVLHGAHRRWHENGQLSLQETYVNGFLHGVSRSWDEAGVGREQYHDMGTQCSRERGYEIEREMLRERALERRLDAVRLYTEFHPEMVRRSAAK